MTITRKNMTRVQQKLKTLFQESLQSFFPREIENILSGISERNLCGRLSIYIDKLGNYILIYTNPLIKKPQSWGFIYS